MTETYYDILGVERDATPAEITTAYRERVLETHPDRNDADDAAEQFDRVKTAESVLSDGTERARYDRLGHDAYVRLAALGSSSTDQTDADPDANVRTESNARSGATSRRSRSRRRANRTRRTTAQPGADHTSRVRWFVGNVRESATDDSSDSRTRARHDEQDSTTDSNPSGFRYAVHEWTGDVELRRSYQSLDRPTLVLVSCLAILYPLLVYSSLTPLFPLVVNVIVAGCTFVLVGYLLTIPRVALVTFGWWSLLAPVGFVVLPLGDPFSVLGLVALACFWVPFGYAVAVWWALLP